MGETVFIASSPNLRDIGGHRTADGGKVRTGLAFRSGALDRLTVVEQEALLATGVRLVCDLRTETERTEQPDALPTGIEHRVLDVQRSGGHGADIASLFVSPEGSAALRSPETAEAFLTGVYRGLVSTQDAHDAYRELMLALAEPGTLMHCTAGKDRTGWGAALLLTVLGVDRETVLADYLASNDHLKSAYAGLYEMVAGYGMDKEIVRPLLEVREVYLNAAFDTVEQTYGGFDGYLTQGLKLAEDDLTALRELYLG